MPSRNTLTTARQISHKILVIRGHKVLLDEELAVLYGVATKTLNRGVRRNLERFPSDFMFRLTKNEVGNLKYQIGTSSWGGRRKLPYAFTEQGVAMLSSVLHTKRAIHVNIVIMRVFVKLREILATHQDLAKKLDALETKYDRRFKVVFDALRQLMVQPESPRRGIGFLADIGGGRSRGRDAILGDDCTAKPNRR